MVDGVTNQPNFIRNALSSIAYLVSVFCVTYEADFILWGPRYESKKCNINSFKTIPIFLRDIQKKKHTQLVKVRKMSSVKMRFFRNVQILGCLGMAATPKGVVSSARIINSLPKIVDKVQNVNVSTKDDCTLMWVKRPHSRLATALWSANIRIHSENAAHLPLTTYSHHTRYSSEIGNSSVAIHQLAQV